MKLTEYIEKKHNGNKAAFARANGVNPQQVTVWINKEFSVDSEGWLCSRRRKLKKVKKWKQNTRNSKINPKNK